MVACAEEDDETAEYRHRSQENIVYRNDGKFAQIS
jgi:hypothetical protein